MRRAYGGSSVPILFLHGSTLPASLALCARFDQISFLELTANHGVDCWCLDFRGYGLSWRPERTNGPVTFTPDAIADLRLAIKHILAETGASEIDIVGWSWGATVAAAYAAQSPTPLRRLVLVAPQWLRETRSALLADPIVLSTAYRNVSGQAVVSRWLSQLEEAQAETLRSSGWASVLSDALANPDNGAGEAPNGPLVEIADCWSQGRPVYDPRDIKVPVLLIVGSHDKETPPINVQRLRASFADEHHCHYVVLPRASHFVPIEPMRVELIAELEKFLRK